MDVRMQTNKFHVASRDGLPLAISLLIHGKLKMSFVRIHSYEHAGTEPRVLQGFEEIGQAFRGRLRCL
jgi:hypothetical protein